MEGFTCPQCGAHKDDPATVIETDVAYVRPRVRLWEGGPLVEDLGVDPEPKTVDRTLTTDACGCSFRLSEWDVAFYTYPNGAAGLQVTVRAAP